LTVLRRVGRQASFYFVAELLGQLTGFISMPIFTRIFTTAQYGIMGLVDSTLLFAGTISGMGLRPAVVRLWGEFKTGKRPGGSSALASTMLSASFLFGALVSALFIGALFLPEAWLPREAKELIAMASGVILFRNVIQMVMSIVQSQERAALRASLILAERYLILGFALLYVAVFRWGLRGFFGGVLTAEGLLFVYCTIYALRRLEWRPRVLNSPVVRESILYGLPLMGLNISGFLTDWGDRFLMTYFREASELGLYVAGYNLSNYATMFFVPALNSALIPVTMNVWSEQGPDEARKSLETFLRYYALVALPVVFGVWGVSVEGIRLLASAKFVAAAQVIPWVLAAKVIQGAYYPFLAGFYLTKRTGKLLYFMAGTAALNLALNWFLIPAMGMLGAAIATLAAYAFYVFGGGIFSQRYLRLRFPVRSFFAYFVAALGMFGVLWLIPSPTSDALTLAIKIPAGALAYAALAALLDREARGILGKAYAKVSRR